LYSKPYGNILRAGIRGQPPPPLLRVCGVFPILYNMLRQMEMHHWTKLVEAIANVIFVSGCRKSSTAPLCSRKRRNLELDVEHTAE